MTLVHHSPASTSAERFYRCIVEATARMRRARARARAISHLRELDDYLLRDIGLEPCAFRATGRLPIA
jgi:uncharacterized protein YjiS (DUF1127 family)